MWVFVILGIALGIFFIYCIVVHIKTKRDIIGRFKTGNVIVEGPKGNGKDVLFGYVVNTRKDDYFGNLDYTKGKRFSSIAPKQLDLNPNTCDNFIKGDIKKVDKIEGLEGKDIYFSDGGVIFPSQADSTLHKIYPGLPIFFALNRHLYNNGMHINTQRLDRVWKALREQADCYILIRRRRIKIPFFIVIYTRVYEDYNSALQRLSPVNSRMFNKFSKAEVDLYKAKHGYIKNGFLIVPKRKLKYDSREFHEVMFGSKAPTNIKKKKSFEENDI